MVKVNKNVCTRAKSNCFFYAHDNHKVVIDPAMPPTDFPFVAENSDILSVLITHGHFDHTKFLRDWQSYYTKATFYIHELEIDNLNKAPKFSLMLDRSKMMVPDFKNLKLLKGDQGFIIENTTEFFRLPFHTRGSTIFVNHQLKIVFIGDALLMSTAYEKSFQNEDYPKVKKFISENFSNYTVFPGHGNSYNMEKNRCLY